MRQQVEEGAAMAASKTETYEFAVQGAPHLVVRDFGGSVHVSAGQPGQVLVRITRMARGVLGGGSESDLEQIHVDVAQRGDEMSIEATLHQHLTLGAVLTADIEVIAPPQARLDLRLNAGNAEIAGLEGPVKAKLNAGNLEVRGGRLEEHSEVECNAGNLLVAAALAPAATLEVHVNAGNARLRLPRATAAHFDARAHVGTIEVTGFPVNVTRRVVQQTASGTFGSNPQSMVMVRVDAGNVVLEAVDED
jgi:hypothetical protein